MPVTLADVAPTAARLLGAPLTDVDGIDLSPALGGSRCAARELYAESFAPLVEFGWAPLRAIRSGPWKLIAAPKPELFDIEQDPGEQTNLAASQPTSRSRARGQRADRYSPACAADRRVGERGERPNACAPSATLAGISKQRIRNQQSRPIRRIGASWPHASRRSRQAS